MTIADAMENTETQASSSRSRLVAFVVAVSFFMQMLDSTIVVTSLPQMARSFGVAPVAMSIGLTVYMLTMAAFLWSHRCSAAWPRLFRNSLQPARRRVLAVR